MFSRREEIVLQMNNQMFFVYVYFDKAILPSTEVGCVFESCHKVGMRFNKTINVEELKRKINAKIALYCGKMMSRLFYKFSISSNPLKFTEMELVDDDDLDTVIAIYCSTGNVNPKWLSCSLS